MNFSMANDTESSGEKLSGYLQDLELVRNIPLFRTLEYECQKLIAMVCKRSLFSTDDVILQQGEDAESAYYILSGTAEALLLKNDKSHRIQTFEAGHFIGSCALLGKAQHIFTLKATSETSTLRVSRKNFQKVMAQYPSNMERVIENFVDEISRWDELLMTTSESNKQDNIFRGVGVSLL